MSNNTIALAVTEVGFTPKPIGARELCIHTSYSNRDNAQGRLRMESVDNGGYGKKHPIVNQQGDVVGAIKNGFKTVGYTYGFVYSEVAQAFAVLHTHYPPTTCCLSFLEPKGRFGWFDDTPKYVPHDSIVLGPRWITSPEGFMLLGEDERLVIVGAHGMITIDTRRRELAGRIDFKGGANHLGYDLSPIVDNVAIAECTYEGDDKVTGQKRYGNYLRIYDAFSCSLLAEKRLDTEMPHLWQVRFSACGRHLQIYEKGTQFTIEMK